MRLLYIHILYVYIGVRIIYCNAVYDTYSDVYVRICTYMPSYEQYIAVTAAVYACISSLYLHIPTMEGGDLCQYMSVYACIYVKNTCIYISPYMYVYPAVFLYVFPAVYLSVFLYVYPAVFFFFVHITVTVPSQLLRIRRRRRAVSAPSPRGRYGKFVARLRKRRQIAKFNQIWSARLTSGSQWQLVQARPYCALKCHGNRGWRSFTR